MADKRTETIDIVVEPAVHALREALDNAGITVDKIILFGSFAHGNETEASDIDLAVFSSAFTGIRFHDVSRIVDSVEPINSRLEIHPFRPEDLSGCDPFASEILRTGIIIYDRKLMLHA
ncbi:nucleotidyltransferase domain-containing protein [Sphingobacteriales bacterium CHB3]|nr:nucleotidyltransferase domain-containing protein [Sphingobacteriales bacterium CHB3]